MLYDNVLQNYLNALDDYDRALVLNPKNEAAARMRAQVNKYYLQQREKLGKNDEMFGYTPYSNEADGYHYNDEYDEQNELRFEDIADDEREEWEEEYLADYLEYVQDWEIYTATYN